MRRHLRTTEGLACATWAPGEWATWYPGAVSCGDCMDGAEWAPDPVERFWLWHAKRHPDCVWEQEQGRTMHHHGPEAF